MSAIRRRARLASLTRRELEVLGLLLEGWTNDQIAAALTIGKRTVVVHLEHVMRKLDAATRTMAAMRARRRGLFIPAELSTG
ncbi:LuxR C-terminal-related transcriptional regulator [Actinoplanes sp. NPDC049548]|uniref:LuxR C-terminal-related transcriptional regulator n=1 Tax=Actinoplanes sp. NPDC049548 TaxID=3155152 RepID=UPI00342CBEF2